jgi:hypothetical protein
MVFGGQKGVAGFEQRAPNIKYIGPFGGIN